MSEGDNLVSQATLEEGTIVDLFLAAVARFQTGPALRYRTDDGWSDISYGEVEAIVHRASLALAALGLNRGDRAAILSENRPEWALSDYACLCAGVVDVPIYSSLTPPQIRYILNDSGARLIFVSDSEQAAKIEAVRSDCPHLEWVIVFDSPEEPTGKTLGWTPFLERGAEAGGVAALENFRASARRVAPEETATILYTSGTTGDPKGVMLSHKNLHSNVRGCSLVLPIDDRDSTLSFLPLSHVLQRMVDYLFFHVGCPIAYARSLQLVTEDLREIRPTIVVSVPRLYEKVYSTVTEAAGLKGAIVEWAMDVGGRWADAKLGRRRPDLVTHLSHRIADRLVFKKIRTAIGDRLRYFVSGGAPLSPEINRFFFSAGVVILEGYGLTETSPVTNVNSPRDFPDNFRIGTVGKALPGTEVRIAEDGEILIRGPQVMKGYYNLPQRTAEAFTQDGWFCTGDVGEIDSEGFLTITDRKKDIIVTAGGKNIAPQPIENRLKKNRYVDQPVVLGDRRKFVSLLLVPDFEAVEQWARSQGLPLADRRGLLCDERVQKLLASEVFGELQHLSRTEMPKKLVLLDQGFTVEDGSLTPTQKVKRRVVEDRFRSVVDTLYEARSEDQTVFTSW